jgi:Fe-S cluster biosynthesis and repair protein YggX
MSDSEDVLPEDVEAAAQAAISTLLPEKSKHLYESAYKKFDEWCTQQKMMVINEKTLLAYFLRTF